MRSERSTAEWEWLASSPSVSRRQLLRGAGILGGGILLAACGQDTGSGDDQPSGQATGGTAPPSKPEHLVVRTWGDPWESGLRDSAGDAFTKETGIGIEYDLTDFGPMQTKIQQALAAGQRPPVDVVHTIGIFAERAVAQDLVTPLDPGIVSNFDDLLPIGHPSGGGSEYVALYSYSFPVIYNSDLIAPPPDMSWSEILDQQYPDSYYAASTFEVLAFPFAKIVGVDYATESMQPVWDELRKLRPNLSGFGQDSDFVTSMQAEQSKWGGFIVGNAFALKDAGVPVEWLIPREGSSLSVDTMYVPRGLPDDVTYWAQKFIDTVIDPENLSQWAEIEGVVPTHSQSHPAEFMVGDPAFPFTEEEVEKYGIPFSLKVAAEHEDEWAASYSAALQG